MEAIIITSTCLRAFQLTSRKPQRPDALLHCELPGIELVRADSPIRQQGFPCATNGKGYEQREQASDLYGRVSEEKELVATGDDDGQSEADDPCADCARGHFWVVRVGDGASHFRIGAVVVEVLVEIVVVQIWIVERCAGEVLAKRE